MILIGKLRMPKRNDSDDSIKEKGYSDRRKVYFYLKNNFFSNIFKKDLSRRTPSPSPYAREKIRKNSKRKDSGQINIWKFRNLLKYFKLDSDEEAEKTFNRVSYLNLKNDLKYKISFQDSYSD